MLLKGLILLLYVGKEMAGKIHSWACKQDIPAAYRTSTLYCKSSIGSVWKGEVWKEASPFWQIMGIFRQEF